MLNFGGGGGACNLSGGHETKKFIHSSGGIFDEWIASTMNIPRYHNTHSLIESSAPSVHVHRA